MKHTYQIDEYGEAFNEIDLYLIPPQEMAEETGTDWTCEGEGETHVYTFGCVGSGTPERGYFSRHLFLGAVPADVVADSLEEWLVEHEEALAGLAGLYKGTIWNGSNWIGQWDCEDTMRDGIDPRQAVADGEIARYWDACDFLQHDTDDALMEAIDDAGSVDDLASDIVDHAKAENVYLCETDVAEYLDEVRQRCERCQECGGEGSLPPDPDDPNDHPHNTGITCHACGGSGQSE